MPPAGGWLHAARMPTLRFFLHKTQRQHPPRCQGPPVIWHTVVRRIPRRPRHTRALRSRGRARASHAPAASHGVVRMAYGRTAPGAQGAGASLFRDMRHIPAASQLPRSFLGMRGAPSTHTQLLRALHPTVTRRPGACGGAQRPARAPWIPPAGAPRTPRPAAARTPPRSRSTPRPARWTPPSPRPGPTRSPPSGKARRASVDDARVPRSTRRARHPGA
jgi:hypothetical protein